MLERLSNVLFLKLRFIIKEFFIKEMKNKMNIDVKKKDELNGILINLPASRQPKNNRKTLSQCGSKG